MAEDRAKITTGPNERATNETIAGTGARQSVRWSGRVSVS